MNETARKALELSRTERLMLWRHAKKDIREHEESIGKLRQSVRRLEDEMAELTAALGDGWKPSEEPEVVARQTLTGQTATNQTCKVVIGRAFSWADPASWPTGVKWVRPRVDDDGRVGFIEAGGDATE